MGLHKGQTNNLAGRKPGTTNKVTQDLRKWVNAFVAKNTSIIERDFKKLKPEQRMLIFEKLLKYVIPQKSELTEIDQLSEEQVNELYNKIIDNLNNPNDEQ